MLGLTLIDVSKGAPKYYVIHETVSFILSNLNEIYLEKYHCFYHKFK